ncbi:MAG: thymidine phosphorylase family protein, partial [Gammaproteobacteria bacterium]
MQQPVIEPAPHTLRLRRLGIDTYQEPVVYMRRDCPVCRSEGFAAHSRVRVEIPGRSVVATLNVVGSEMLADGEAGLSEAAWELLQPEAGQVAHFAHPMPLESFRHVRAKLFRHRFSAEGLRAIIEDVANRRYSDVQLSALLSACADRNLNDREIFHLTSAMVDSGERLRWPNHPVVVDKHCVGGLPGNRTTPIVVAIATACGLIMPKTSSRAITSPAGTADTMETLTNVSLDLPAMRRVVEKEGGCLAWGGSVHLSPADDVLIGVERALELDSEAQLIASILSKKAAAGSTHVLIDIPFGPAAKVREERTALRLSQRLRTVGKRLGLHVAVVITDGSQPVGWGIGPALEARDVLAVLQCSPQAPRDLRERALMLAANVLELGGAARHGEGRAIAASALDSGRAWAKFQAICKAQGGLGT